MQDEASVSWSTLTAWRSECYQRFGSIHDLPMVDVAGELERLVGAAHRVLDFGAGVDQPLRRMLGAATEYRSLDTDPAGRFDYGDVSEIPEDERFDLVVANMVLEHVPLASSPELVSSVAGVLEPGGRFAATVPNPLHPVRHWGDATHLTAWPPDDLYGLFKVGGLEVESLARYGKRRLSWWPVSRMIVRIVAAQFRIDWADSLLIVGRKPSAA
jgi:trans-aconitate methyltransferase